MYSHWQRRLVQEITAFLRRRYELELPQIAVEQPPRIEMGEFALPLAFELARKLRKPPRKIADEIVAELGAIEGVGKLEVAGAGYINVRLDRGAAAAAILEGSDQASPPGTWEGEKILVEHTSINPNKAAHVGHLRNAILGDTFVRLLRAGGVHVAVQNYIDNTGVQVADIIVGLLDLENLALPDVRKLMETQPRFDYLCWDLYAQVSEWYGEDKQNLARRQETLHAIEQGGNEESELAEAVSTTILRRHLQTMERLGIEYDLLPRESEILRLKFWDAAFQQLKEKGVLRYETEGKNAGCWVMPRPGAPPSSNAEDAKVIVRSNGTVGYVGKDIAYHLWKFGLLGKDFGYRRFYQYAAESASGLAGHLAPGQQQNSRHECWISAEQGEIDHPHFGGASAVYNVIDARQAEAQNAVMEALRAMGYGEAADHYSHFSYEMVALTPRCAQELGYDLSEDDRARNFIEVSGRRGFGVKADDLIDELIQAALSEVQSRHAELPLEECHKVAKQIALGALRYFMLKFTRNSVIAFDFKDALSFEGETGPYVQYAVVRATSIFRKAGVSPEQALRMEAAQPNGSPNFTSYFHDQPGNELWELWLSASKTAFVIEQCVSAAEPAHAAHHAFQLAQLFNNFYHHHRILSEPDEARKRFLLATAAVARRELIRILTVMGISVPSVM